MLNNAKTKGKTEKKDRPTIECLTTLNKRKPILLQAAGALRRATTSGAPARAGGKAQKEQNAHRNKNKQRAKQRKRTATIEAKQR